MEPKFAICLHRKDILVLEQIKSFFGVGSIVKQESKALFQVRSIKDLLVIIKHLDEYPLITQKLADYLI